MPVWQKKYEQYKDKSFTIVGIALDVQGIPPAKLYYDQHKVTFPSLVDPNYETKFGVVPKTFFVNEHGVVQPLKNWESRLTDPVQPITEEISSQWSKQSQSDRSVAMRKLEAAHRSDSTDLAAANELASHYLSDKQIDKAKRVLESAVSHYDAHDVALSAEKQQKQLLAQTYLQLARATESDQQTSVRYATLSYYLNPTIGFAKQISRLIAPEKFDNRPQGGFDNQFRESTRRRLEKQRREWLNAKG